MAHLIFFLFAILNATLFAFLEIHIEGKEGWAAKLPTWRVQNFWTRILYSGKPFTGYHMYVLLFVLAIVHLPFALSLTPWTWQAELRILAFMIFFWIFEDFLWFVLNPAFTLRKFKAEHIWWHAPTWWWIMPRDYWIFTPLALLLYWASWR
jgi:hypothetical protein